MPLVLVEDVADHAVAAPAHDVVVLAAFLEMDLGAEILARLAAVLGVAHHEARRGEGARTHLVDEIDLAAVADFQPNPAVLAVLHLDFVALLAQFGAANRRPRLRRCAWWGGRRSAPGSGCRAWWHLGAAP